VRVSVPIEPIGGSRHPPIRHHGMRDHRACDARKCVIAALRPA
jgi:hypothetical protein